MRVTVLENAKVLVPKHQHQSFTETTETILKGTVINGEPKYITGLRKSEPFTYRMFLTDDGKLIHLNKVITKSTKNNNNMEKTEVKLGASGDVTEGQSYADGGKPKTVINLKPGEYFSKLKLIGLFGGGIAGFAYCKYKKHDAKTTLKYVAAGAILGYAAAFMVDAKREATVNKAKGKTD